MINVTVFFNFAWDHATGQNWKRFMQIDEAEIENSLRNHAREWFDLPRWEMPNLANIQYIYKVNGEMKTLIVTR